MASNRMPNKTMLITRYCARLKVSLRKILDSRTENTLYEAMSGATMIAFFAIA